MRKESNRIDALRAKKAKRLPTVLTRDEIHRVFAHLSGVNLLMARLLYGSGLRLKDLDSDYRTIAEETLDYVVREMTYVGPAANDQQMRRLALPLCRCCTTEVSWMGTLRLTCASIRSCRAPVTEPGKLLELIE